MLRRLKHRLIAALTRRGIRYLAARYDAARTDADNRKHWANADNLSADAALSPSIRQTLRSRVRYEYDNNGYLRGIVRTYADFVVGTGVRLQSQLESDTLNEWVEREFAHWMEATRLARKLRQLIRSMLVDGEAFGLLITNRALPTPVKLDLRLIDADRVTTPGFGLGAQRGRSSEMTVDGIEFDGDGNPVAYHVLKQHPGSQLIESLSSATDYDRVPAEQVIHYFDTDRAEQHRGVSPFVSVLDRFAKLRRYTTAVVMAAEFAASLSVLFKTTMPPGGEAAGVEQPMTLEIEPNTAMFLPEGWEPMQLRVEHPATDYAKFKREVLTEAGRPIAMPYNVAACDSSDYNYASGRLDHQTFFRSVRIERANLGLLVLDRLFGAWLREASLVSAHPRNIVQQLEQSAAWPHTWYWDGFQHVDPAKEALAEERRLKSNATTLARVYAEQGLDWERELRQRARELELMRELNVPIPETKGAR